MPEKSHKGSPFDLFQLVLVNLMWAAQYSAYKTASNQMGPVTLTFWIFVIASLLLLPILVREHRKSGTPPELKGVERSLTAPRNLFGFFIVGILGLVPGSAFLAWGTDISTAANASLLYLTVPIITAILAVWILKERMTWVHWTSLLLALVGVLFVSDVDWRHPDIFQARYLAGNGLVLLACTSSSFYNVYSKELLRRFTPLEVLIYGYVLAAIISVPLLLAKEPFSFQAVLNYRLDTWASLLVLSLLSWGLAMVLWMRLLRHLDVSKASISIYLLPFLGVLIAALTLHEKITLPMVIGGGITLIGTALVNLWGEVN